MAGFIVDNSVWGRIDLHESVRSAFEAVASREVIFSCAPQRLEFLYSARSAKDFLAQRAYIDEIAFLLDDDSSAARRSEEMQTALAAVGQLRAVGALDLLIAGYADCEGATVLHYDADFDHIASVWPSLKTAWVVPRGSLDA